MRGGCSPVALRPSGVARLPLTQRAFRSPAGARVTFLLRAQKKSNPKKTAFRAGSIAWDRSVGRFARANSWLPKARHRGYTATRRSAEGLKRGSRGGFLPARLQQTSRPSVKPALSPHRLGALRGSCCVSAMGRNLSVWPRPSGSYPAQCYEPLGHFLGSSRNRGEVGIDGRGLVTLAVAKHTNPTVPRRPDECYEPAFLLGRFLCGVL